MIAQPKGWTPYCSVCIKELGVDVWIAGAMKKCDKHREIK